MQQTICTCSSGLYSAFTAAAATQGTVSLSYAHFFYTSLRNRFEEVYYLQRSLQTTVLMRLDNVALCTLSAVGDI